MKIVLLGYMASGKTSIAKKLAKALELSFIDLDDYISEKEQMSIPELFENKGEIYFRKIEAQCLEEILKSDQSVVLALGGGTPCYGKNMNLVTTYANSFYLKANLPTLYKKLSKPKNKVKRPLISEIPDNKLEEFIAKHLFERVEFYSQADYTITIDSKTKKEIVAEISSNMQSSPSC